ncbi:hypothetical protein EHM92_08050, partial [bacterium]
MRSKRSFTRSSSLMTDNSPQPRTLTAVLRIVMAEPGVLVENSKTSARELLEEYCQLVRHLLPEYNGREIPTSGQELTAAFNTPLEAIRCAVKIQSAAFERNNSTSRERRFALRIGAHLGEITRGREQVSSDGLSFAARIALLAAPGGICMSEGIARQIRNEFDLPLSTVSKRQVRSSGFSIRLYRVALPWRKERRRPRRLASMDQEPEDPRACALLKTKLAVPLARAGIVPRQRLIDRINQSLAGKLTLIAAPAGFGKTTLLIEWISQSGRPVG